MVTLASTAVYGEMCSEKDAKGPRHQPIDAAIAEPQPPIRAALTQVPLPFTRRRKEADPRSLGEPGDRQESSLSGPQAAQQAQNVQCSEAPVAMWVPRAARKVPHEDAIGRRRSPKL